MLLLPNTASRQSRCCSGALSLWQQK
uniref:Uncharacterized protein n=1 Tax=Anguilla anguilla TaxID=7936 RepID=A0A0E9S9Q4_ANGAN